MKKLIVLLLLFSGCNYQNNAGIVVTSVNETSPKQYTIGYTELWGNDKDFFDDTIRWNIGDTLKFKK